jgi:hypothetical protein
VARDYAQIMTAIWRDRDFRALCSADQRMYLLVTTQPDITAAGTLPLTVGRWSTLAEDTTPDDVRASLERLAEARFVCMDTVTEELLVRSFVRWDKGYGNPKRWPVIRRSAAEIVSPRLAAMLAAEFVSLGLPTDSLADALSDCLSDGRSAGVVEELPAGGFEGVPERSALDDGLSTGDGLFPQVDRLSGSLSAGASRTASPSDGVVVTKVSSSSPQPLTHTPAASGRDAASGSKRKAKRASRATTLPPDWQPTDEHGKRAVDRGLDLAKQAELFRLHAETHEREAKNWNAAFTMWLTKANDFDRAGSQAEPHRAPVMPLVDREAARQWLLGEHAAGRVSEIERRTSLRYQRPDLPAEVAGREAPQWLANHVREWIKAHHQAIVDQLIEKDAA